MWEAHDELKAQRDRVNTTFAHDNGKDSRENRNHAPDKDERKGQRKTKHRKRCHTLPLYK